MSNLDMQRARHAMARIDEVVAAQASGQAALYGSYAKSLPASIRQIGLGQAMATLLAKAKGKREDAHHFLYRHIQSWLCDTHAASPYHKLTEQPDLLQHIIEGDEDAYIRAQAEVMAYLTWLKKLAVARLDSEERD